MCLDYFRITNKLITPNLKNGLSLELSKLISDNKKFIIKIFFKNN